MNTTNGKHGDLSTIHEGIMLWEQSVRNAKATGLKTPPIPEGMQSWEDLCNIYAATKKSNLQNTSPADQPS